MQGGYSYSQGGYPPYSTAPRTHPYFSPTADSYYATRPGSFSARGSSAVPGYTTPHYGSNQGRRPSGVWMGSMPYGSPLIRSNTHAGLGIDYWELTPEYDSPEEESDADSDYDGPPRAPMPPTLRRPKKKSSGSEYIVEEMDNEGETVRMDYPAPRRSGRRRTTADGWRRQSNGAAATSSRSEPAATSAPAPSLPRWTVRNLTKNHEHSSSDRTVIIIQDRTCYRLWESQLPGARQKGEGERMHPDKIAIARAESWLSERPGTSLSGGRYIPAKFYAADTGRDTDTVFAVPSPYITSRGEEEKKAWVQSCCSSLWPCLRPEFDQQDGGRSMIKKMKKGSQTFFASQFKHYAKQDLGPEEESDDEDEVVMQGRY
ncbi:hypothetical protein L202_04873 [Cryptococcus amylolentus CBS 6039]|uniref:Uncharacterized protein n=1 Tax=Cryptococcus amylolentus CBS 6039 TaxID=1295533 RepID=A0A1E3HN28_9TREE|nr:hypothetical protein L202_04873 [Cryptococcus amylolentus CBS 6039]ODN77732.1 hypothetical protein L202_04873 [Cryptococcus amylolentus CBS 6039]